MKAITSLDTSIISSKIIVTVLKLSLTLLTVVVLKLSLTTDNKLAIIRIDSVDYQIGINDYHLFVEALVIIFITSVDIVHFGIYSSHKTWWSGSCLRRASRQGPLEDGDNPCRFYLPKGNPF